MLNAFTMLNFLTSTADTTEYDTTTASTMSMLFSLVLMIVVFYFFLIRPQKKKDKEQKQMRDSLRVGDEIVTIGGIIGIIVRISSETETLLIETGNDRSHIRIKTWAISENLTKHDSEEEIALSKKK